MAITTYQTPSTYTPAYNPQIFVALSNQTVNSGFLYKVVCTNTKDSSTRTYSVKQDPSNYLKFDGIVFSEKKVEHYVPNNAYGWQVVEDGLQQIQVELKEFYGGVTYPGSPPYLTTYYVWNGVNRVIDWTDYDQNDYVFNSASSNLVTLNDFATDYTYEDKSSFLYVLQSAVNAVNNCVVKTYDAAGILIGTSTIDNPFIASLNFYDQYICIDLGHKGLSNISAGLVTGTYPIITDSVASYTVELTSDDAETLFVKTYTILCEPKHRVYTVHYLGNKGGFNTLHFPKVSQFSEDMEKTTYRRNPYTFASNTWSYSKFAHHERVSSSTGQEKLVLTTDWMTNEDYAKHRQILNSPVHYIDFGSSIGLIPYKLTDVSFLGNEAWNQKNVGMQLTFELTAKNNYQRA